MDELIKIAVGFGISWAILTVLLFVWLKARLTKSIEHEYAMKLEKHSTDLRHQSELALKDFESKASERNIKLTNIFERQANTIVETYKRLVKLLYIAKEISYATHATCEKQNELNSAFHKCITELQIFFDEGRILIPADTALQIEACIRLVDDFTMQYGHQSAMLKTPPGVTSRAKILEGINDRLNKLMPELNMALSKLVSDLQKILGVRI